MEYKEKVRTRLSIKFQVICILVSMGVFISFLFLRSAFFITREKIPYLHPITPAVYKELGGFAKTVQTGLYINQFIDFNMVTNDFTFDGTVWFTFDPGVISIDTLQKFTFLKGKIIHKSSPLIKMIDKKLNVQYQVRATFSSVLDYTDFPLDDHQIYIILINQFVSPSEVIFESFHRQFVVDATVAASGWRLVNRAVQVGYLKSELDPDNPAQQIIYPAAMFILDYERNTIRYALSIVLPLALISYLMLFGISLRLWLAISITAAGITAILAYRFVIENLSPTTGFFMLSDYLFFLFLVATITSFIINVAETQVDIPSFYKKLFIIFMHTVMMVSVIYVLFLW